MGPSIGLGDAPRGDGPGEPPAAWPPPFPPQAASTVSPPPTASTVNPPPPPAAWASEPPGPPVPVGPTWPPGPPVADRGATPTQLGAVALLAGGVGVGAASFLPAYLGGTSLASQAYQAVAHAIPLAGFALAAVLAVVAARPSARARPPLGLPGVLGLGVASLGLGLVVTDVGQAVAGSRVGPGLVLAVVEWVLCAAGSVLALRPGLVRPQRPVASARGASGTLMAAALLLAGVVVAWLFAPAWDRYVLDLTALGRTSVVTAGNAFDQPGLMVAGSVTVMVAVVAVALAAGLVRQAKVAATLLAGALVVLVAQVVSALVQWRSPLAPSQFGLSPGRAAALGLHVDAGFTASFYGFCAGVVALAVLAAGRALLRGRPALAGPERSLAPDAGTFSPPPGASTPGPPAPSSSPAGGPETGPVPGPRRAFRPTPHY